MTRTNATLKLNFSVRDNRTILRVQKQEPPLRVVRAFPIGHSHFENGPALVHANGLSEATTRAKPISSPSVLSLPNSSQIGQAATKAQAAAVKAQAAAINTQAAAINAQAETIVQPALVHLQNVSGGVLGGDQLRLEATVEAGAQAQLTTTGSTRIYRHRDGYPITTQATALTVESGALLEYLPDTLIPYARSQYRQATQINLADGAGLFYWEVVTPGREAKGECFDYDRLQIELDIVADGRPIAVERSRIEPAQLAMAQTGMNSLTRLGAYPYFATFYICRVGIEKQVWLELEKLLDAEARVLSTAGQTMWGVSTLPAHGLSVRGVGTSSYAIQQTLPHFWQLAKAALYQQNAMMPRKMY